MLGMDAARIRHDALSTGQAAALLGVHPQTLRSMVRAGRGPAVFRLPSGRLRFRRRDVEAWVTKQRGQRSGGDAA